MFPDMLQGGWHLRAELTKRWWYLHDSLFGMDGEGLRDCRWEGDRCWCCALGMSNDCTSFLRSAISTRNCSTSVEVVTFEIEGVATSIIWSACSARLSKLVVLVEASTMHTLEGNHCKNNSRKNETSVLLAFSPSSCCIRLSNCVDLGSPSSSALNSCWSRRCSEAAVRCTSCFFKTS